MFATILYSLFYTYFIKHRDVQNHNVTDIPDSPRNPPPNSERETKVWISVSSTSSTVKAATASPSPNNNGHPIGADIVLVPVRTSGSVVADGISHKKQKKSEGSSLPSLTGSGPIIDSTSLGDGTSPEPEVQGIHSIDDVS